MDLGLAARLPVIVERERAAPAEIQEAREVPDRGVQPDVEVLVLLARDLEAEVGRVAGDVPVAQPRAEPLLELGRDRRLQAARSGPLAEHGLEVAELEEQVLGLALDRGRAAQHGDGVLQVGRRVRRAAGLAAVAVLVGRAAARAGAPDVAVRQEHPRLLVVGLADRRAAYVPAREQPPVDLLGELPALRRMRGVEVVDRDVEVGEIAGLLHAHPRDQVLGRDAFLPCLEHDRRAVRVARADEQAVVSAQPLVADPDVGLDVFQRVAEVQSAVGVRQCAGDEKAAGRGGHGVAGVGKARDYDMPGRSPAPGRRPGPALSRLP